MALKSTIHKAELQIADMDRGYYHEHQLTLARHPSETDERMMVRLLAFALYADEMLAFGKGLSADDEPDLWLKDMTGAVQLWIDVGLPDERNIRKACGRAKQVVQLIYGGRTADMWWQQNSARLLQQKNLAVINLPSEATQAMQALVARSMTLSFTRQDGQIWLSSAEVAVEITPVMLLASGDPGHPHFSA